MPCRYYTEAEERQMAHDRADKAERERAKASGELDLATRLLCLACRKLDGAEIPMGPELKKWWAQHKKKDTARRRAERAAK